MPEPIRARCLMLVAVPLLSCATIPTRTVVHDEAVPAVEAPARADIEPEKPPEPPFPYAGFDARASSVVEALAPASFGDPFPLHDPADEGSDEQEEDGGPAPAKRAFAVLRHGEKWLLLDASVVLAETCDYDGGRFTCAGGVSLEVEEIHPGPPKVDEELWDSWRSVNELLVLDRPIWAEHDGDWTEEAARAAWTQARELEEAGDFAALLGHVEELPWFRTNRSDWEKMRARALRRGDFALVAALYARLGLPMGRCSQDGTPIFAMLQYADACLGAGRRACFLNLVLHAMANAAPRVASSSLAVESFDSPSARLSKAEIDVSSFLLGLLAVFSNDEEADGEKARSVGIPPDYLALAIAGSGVKEEVLARLALAVERDTVDELNRLRALHMIVNVNALEWKTPEEKGKRSRREDSWIEERQARERARLEAHVTALRGVEPLQKGMLASSWYGEEKARAEAALEDLPRRQAEERERIRENERQWRNRKWEPPSTGTNGAPDRRRREEKLTKEEQAARKRVLESLQKDMSPGNIERLIREELERANREYRR